MASHAERRESLTPREREVLELLRLGLTDREIAQRLGVKPPAVSRHVSEIIAKLGVRNRYEAATWPERPRWWAGVVAPVALLWRRAGALLPLNGSTLAMAASGGTLLALLGGLALIGVLLARAGADAEGDSPDDAARVQVAATGVPVLVALSPPSSLSPQSALDPMPASTPQDDATPTPSGPDATPPSSDTPPPDATRTPAPPSTPSLEPTATPTLTCGQLGAPAGWVYVYFQSDVPEQRALEIAQEVGGSIVPIDVLMMPLAFPTPVPGPGEYAEVVAVEPGREAKVVALLEGYTEVTRAEAARSIGCP